MLWLGRSHLISVDMFLNDALCQSWPRLLLPNIVNKLSNTGGRHVVDDDVRLGRKPLKEPGQSVQRRDLPAILRTAGGPEEKMAAFVAQPLQRLPCPAQQFAVRIHKGEVYIDEDVGVFHAAETAAQLYTILWI